MVRGLRLLILICFIIALIGANISSAGEIEDMTAGIEAYKKGNYEECITKLKNVVKDDPTSAISYYYLGLAYTKTDKKVSAVQNYNKVINLGSDTTLVNLAKQGKQSLGEKKVTAIEEQIEEIEEEYNPIFNDSAEVPVSKNEKVKEKQTKTTSDPERETTAPKQNAELKYDPNREPTNDEIVNAIKILQKAGLLQNGAAAITGGNPQQTQQMQQMMPQMDSRTQQMNAMMQMMNNGNNNNNMMPMMQMMNNGGKVDPQLMQMMLMQQMMPNFGGGNNNNGY